MTFSRLQSRRSARAGRLGALMALLALGGAACSDTQKKQGEASARQQVRALSAEPASVRTSTGLEAVQGELLVRFKPQEGLAAAQQAHAALGATVAHTYRSLEGLQLVRLPQGLDVEAAAEQYMTQPGVLYAEPNYLYHTAALSDDPRLGDLWGLNNTGQSNGTADADINAPEAWDITTGSDSTVIAVIDSGVNYLHEDLADNMWVNPGEVPDNDVDDDNNGYVDDIHGINAITNTGDPMDDNRHGSHCAGTIAGRGNNAIGVAGVNWRASIIGCKFLSASGSGSTANALKCMDYLHNLRTRASNPVDLVATSNSWGGGAFSQALQDAIERHQQAGILFVAAAGNNNANNDTTANFPSNYPLANIIAVAATDRNDAKASFSSFGRRRVHIAAPGVDVLSTTLGTNGYELLSGTSMATPHVTGLVGLLKAQDPSRDWRALRNLVLAGGQNIASMNGITVTGRRIRAADTGGRGSLTCDNQPFTTRLSPIPDTLQLLRGAKVELSALNINCASPAGDVVLNVAPTGTTITLTDTGTGLDRVAGDGIYTTEWEPPTAGSYTLTFPSGETVSLTVMDVYRPAVALASEWRTITGTPLNLADNTSLQVTPPFPIRYGNHSGFTTAWVSSEGYLSFTDNRMSSSNVRLPTTTFQTLVSPYWDSLHTASATPGNVYTEVRGTAPNREWVVEWRNIGHSTRSSIVPYESITFQAVFFENSPEVLFNYQDVDFGNGTGTLDRGVSATVGLQVNATTATLFGFNVRTLTPDLSLLWRINAPPVMGDLSATPASVPEGSTLQVSAPFTDADGAADGDWAAEADFNYNGTTFDVEATQVLSAQGTASFSRVFPQSGRYTVGLRVRDRDGAFSVVRTLLVDITNVAPVAGALSADPAQGTEGSPLRFVSSFSDVGVSDSPWRFQLDLDYDGTTFNVDRERTYTLAGPVELTHTFPEDGPRTVAMRIVDLDGAVSNVRTLQLNIQDVNPVIRASSVTPATGSEPRTVEFSVSAVSGSADATLDPVSYYHWDFDGDGSVDLLTTSPRAVYRYVDNPQGGDTWPAQVWVEDEDSRTQVSLPVVVNNTPPTLAAVPPAHTAQEGTAFRLQLSATDSAGMHDPLTWQLQGAPEGMSITPSGLLQWVPAFQQTSAAGTAYTVQVTVRDDDGASASASFTVAATWRDGDGDGMPDTWERANGLDPTRNDASEDADGDGVSNYDEAMDAHGGPRLPGRVLARSPLHAAHMRTTGLTLVVDNTVDPDSPTLTYQFRLYADEALTQEVASASVPGHASGRTVADIPDSQLADNTTYWWRARAHDGALHGPWSEARSVYYNPLNDAPTAPLSLSPAGGVSTPDAQPTLVVLNAEDTEGDARTYEFEVRAGSESGQVVASTTGVPEGRGATRHALTSPLAGGLYVWRARAVDSQGAQGPWSASATFRIEVAPPPPANRAPSAPLAFGPANGTSTRDTRPTLMVINAQDLEGDALAYEFEVRAGSESGQVVASATGVAEGTGGTRHTLADALGEGLYVWRARAVDSQGAQGPWSASASFRVEVAPPPPANRAPSAPLAVSPLSGTNAITAQLALTVYNAQDAEGQALTYEFAVYSDAALAQQVATATVAEDASGYTSATVDGASLADDTRYWWRARATDGSLHGPWSAAQMVYLNAVNGPPTAPLALGPANGVSTQETRPTLTLVNAQDPEGDALTYEFEVRAGATDGQVAASATGVAQGPGGTSFALASPLAEGVYVWRARAVDSRSAQGPWSAPATFRVALPASPQPEPPASGCSATGPGSALGLLPLLLAGLGLRRRRNG